MSWAIDSLKRQVRGADPWRHWCGAALALGLATAPATAAAEVRTPAQVRYQTQNGPSQWHKMEVTLVRGAELNKATRTYDYNHYGSFGVLFFGPGQAAVIELENLIIGCPLEFTATCLPRIGNLTGEDQDGTRWEICTQRYCY